MSWSCIPCTYSLEPVGESSPTSYLGTLQSELANSKNIPDAFCCSDNLTGFYQYFPFGTILSRFGPIIPSAPTSSDEQERCGLTLSSRVGFLAKILAQPEEEKESRARKADSGKKWQGSSVKYDRSSRSWKIRRFSPPEGWEPFSGTWPRWGTMRGGECWEHATSGLRTKEIASGSPLPTPTANSYGTCQGGGMGRTGKIRPSLQSMAKSNTWPTIRSTDGERGGRGDLIQAVRGNSNTHFKFATPTKSDGSGGPGRGGREGGDNLRTQVGGSLNPNWVAWLMGWPVGWESLDPLSADNLYTWLTADGSEWWNNERGLPRVVPKIPNRVSRIKALGNGQVPVCAALAWEVLTDDFSD
jgi:hypothetical protein